MKKLYIPKNIIWEDPSKLPLIYSISPVPGWVEIEINDKLFKTLHETDDVINKKLLLG